MDNIPKLDYWMLNVIHEALQKEYDYRLKAGKFSAGLTHISKEQGIEKAIELEKEIQNNQFHPIGKVFQSMKRIEEIREAITKEATK